MSDILLAEYTLKRALREHTTDLIPTTNPHILCTPLPKHWRSNKSLPSQFRVVSLTNIPDGTRVSVTAGNEERPYAELKNPVTIMHANEARFSDLRFLGRSGRGKSFNITITIETTPLILAVYSRAIKVTVDGPRVPRNKYSTIRSVKLHKESRRLGNRGFSSIDHGRTGRPPGSRSAFFQQDALRLNLRRSLLNARESLRESKDQLNGRFRNPGSAFSPALPTGKSNIQQLHSPTVSEPAGHNFFPHGQQPTPGEKSPASSETSLPSFSTGSESRLPFAPLESAYLLSFINDAYARLLARQLQMPASKYKNSDRTEDNQARNKIPVHGPVSSPNVDPQKFVSANGEMKPDFWRNINSVLFDRTGSSNVHSSFRTATQDFPGLPPLFSLSSAVRNVSKQAEMCSSRNSMGNGCSSPNPAWCSLLQQCDFRINKVNQFAAPNPGPFPNPILSTGFNQTGSLYGQTRNTDAISPPFAPTPGNPTFPAYDPTFYSILGSVFASMFQQTSFAPGGCGEKSGLLSVQNLTGNGVSPDDDLLQNSDPINLKLRHQDPLPNLNGTGDSCPKSSNNAILSIERLLEVTNNNNNNNRQPELQLHNRNGLGSPSAMQRLEVACNLSQRSNMSRISPSFSKHGFTGHSFLL